uniref:Uncharacterized protein n=1 Tax=Anolis carolinensis TaxID=28377 RepID=A0A803TVG7_ANOCA
GVLIRRKQSWICHLRQLRSLHRIWKRGLRGILRWSPPKLSYMWASSTADSRWDDRPANDEAIPLAPGRPRSTIWDHFHIHSVQQLQKKTHGMQMHLKRQVDMLWWKLHVPLPHRALVGERGGTMERRHCWALLHIEVMDEAHMSAEICWMTDHMLEGLQSGRCQFSSLMVMDNEANVVWVVSECWLPGHALFGTHTKSHCL